MRKLRGLLLIICFIFCSGLRAQEDGYFLEIGPAGGTSFYLGDANSTLFADSRASFGLMLRYNITPLFSLKGNLLYAGIKGSTAHADGNIPFETTFSRNLFDFGAQFEVSFLNYGIQTFGNCHKLSPYFLIGCGFSFAPKPLENNFAVNFPVGAGLRYKVAKRANLGFEWTFRFSSSDKLDVSEDYSVYSLESPFLIKGKGLQNKDSYSILMLYVTIDVLQKPCNCNTQEIKRKRK
ncbi:MAG: DUF6089 family protein [Bacteroidaceae bacterium]|nr:DUF6089 family protein [Bacteroidaceae bacterium]